MDATTAALALIIAQTCIALVLVGAHFATRPEPATAYWALSAILILIGVMMVVFSGRLSLLHPLGSGVLVFGGALQFMGLQAFYKVKPGATGWIIASVATLLLLSAGTQVYLHVIVLATALLILLAMSFRVLLAGIRTHWTFASVLTLGAIVLLMSNNVIRIVQAIAQDSDLLVTRSAVGIVSLYLVPLGGIFLYATGLLLLYFERLVEIKNTLATHDELTGLLNRRAIVAMGERELTLALRQRQPLTVAFVDIDFFKRVNDGHGHEVGDGVLVETAKLLRDSCRKVDLIGRYGGDEFCLVFPGVSRDCSAHLGERMLQTMRDHRFRDLPRITMSIGFASLPADGDPSWASLIHRADMALYDAKAMGRNRFCIAPETPSDPSTGASRGR